MTFCGNLQRSIAFQEKGTAEVFGRFLFFFWVDTSRVLICCGFKNGSLLLLNLELKLFQKQATFGKVKNRGNVPQDC